MSKNLATDTSTGWRAGVAIVALAAAGALASPAAMAQEHGHYIGEVVTVEPPAPRVEVVGHPPHRGDVWEAGYWNWEGGRHVWHGGRWEGGRPGYRWEPHAWVHEGRGWHLREGYWVRG